MKNRSRGWLLRTALVMFPAVVWAQAESRPPREFPAFRGTWILDASAGSERIGGLPTAHTLTITTTPTEISLVKDSGIPEVYRLDGTETKIRDPRTGAEMDRRYSFVLVAEAVALTSKLIRHARGHAFTNIITDAYVVAGDQLSVERQLSVLMEPPGNLATLEDSDNNRQTLVYRRNTQAPAR